jgi:hypothetical protein
MKVSVELLTEKGQPVDTVDIEFPKAACLSDVAQQAPKLIIQYDDQLFGFSSYHSKVLIFRRKELLCV